MDSFSIPYGDATINCLRFGQGPELLIALHGFGDSAKIFLPLEKKLGQQYTLVAFDLPFHGRTHWPGELFQKADISRILQKIMELDGHLRLSLLGFSFGARVVLAVLPDWMPRINRIILLSPDGIHTKGLNLAIRTPMAVQQFLRKILYRPEWLLRLVRAGNLLKLVPRFYLQFLAFNLTRDDRRQRLFGYWAALPSFRLNKRAVQALLKNSDVTLEIFIGSADNSLRPGPIKQFARKIPTAKLIVLNAGHDVLPRFADF